MTKEETQKLISSRIKLLREERGMTLQAFADFIEVPKTSLIRWEKGALTSMKLSVLSNIAKKCNVSDGWIMGGNVPRRRPSENETTRRREVEKRLVGLSDKQLEMILKFINDYVEEFNK